MFFSDPVLLRVSLACGATQFVTYATLNFTTLFLMREKGMTLNEVAIWYALMVGVSAWRRGCSPPGGSSIASRRVPGSAYAWLPAVGLTLAIPFFIGFVWAPTWPLALALLAFPMFLNYFYLSPAVTLVQEEVRPHERVLAGALLLLVMNLIGLGLGPTWLGAVSDWFRPSHPQQFTATGFLRAGAVLCGRRAAFPVAGACVRQAERGREAERSTHVNSLRIAILLVALGGGHARRRRNRRRQFAPPENCRGPSTASCTCSRAFRTRCRPSARCAGSRRCR